MSDFFSSLIMSIVTFSVVGLIWALAHITVASDCDKLGSFYVGNNVYECKLKGKKVD